MFKHLSAYMCISLMLYFLFVKSVDKCKRLSEEIVTQTDCNSNRLQSCWLKVTLVILAYFSDSFCVNVHILIAKGY